ncbi:presenilins-associated rhomboid-like protein, mitochondrial [Hylaeus anthracinus]|uniref:presenilins-associated rhomboid-like protein, mitochondrial n=1 Tax=Hylaeus anthracinus TaxID=313031 RepID=UPI0023BA0ECF|nr:presenilins-associated rhomboid-like protein, mitochondrial [Hylaeus anthracinus]XP_054016733.1 presenilins-associated rhomboid-like protein, mitochondrial [Hylaeus anthracinus]XP_054016734.1 presenilins-associated rhomboid-like protein, mitochondrial [Hylaeus anthracinus]
MAVRPFLYLGDSVCKCVFSTLHRKPKLRTDEIYRQTRNFKKLRGRTRVSEESFAKDYVERGPVHFSKMLKPFAFTVVFSGTTFVAAAIWEYERIRERTYRIINHYNPLKIRRTGWRHDMEIWWKNLAEGRKIFMSICFLNVMVFLAWRLPVFQKTMVQYFCTNPASRAVCWPMLLSSFSHYSFLHLAANMYALHSFSSLAVAALGKEQFLALYLTCGVVSSFASNLFKVTFGLQGLSLGASGAVMGVFGFICTQFPDTYFSIIFLPMYKFTAGMALKAIMSLDILGCLLRWQYFDHAGHLGGVLFGMFWQAWGNANIWQKREPILTLWHELRGPPGSR